MHEKPLKSKSTEQTNESELEKMDSIEAVQSVLDEIDEKTLTDIYSEYLEKADCPERISNHIPTKHIRVEFNPEKYVHGAYNSERHAITINAGSLFKESSLCLLDVAKERGLINSHEKPSTASQEEFFKMCVLDTRIHEGAHALTLSSCINTEILDGVPTEVRHDRVGLSLASTYANPETGVKMFRLLGNEMNEGITEILAGRILNDYIERSGKLSRQEARLFYQVPENERSSYSKYIFSARIYFLFISALSNVPEDIVELGILRAYLRGEEFFTEEVFEAYLELGNSVEDGYAFHSMIMGGDDFTNISKAMHAAIAKLDDETFDRYSALVEETISKHFEGINPIFEEHVQG